MTVFINNKKYSFSEDYEYLLEDDVPILKQEGLCAFFNLNDKELIITADVEEGDDYICKAFRFNIANGSLEYIFDRDIQNIAYFDNKIMFLAFPNEEEQESYSLEKYSTCLYCYDFYDKEVKLILHKNIDDVSFGGHKDKIYFMYDDEDKIITLDVNTLKTNEYCNDVLKFVIKDDNIYIKSNNSSELIIKNIDSNTENIITNFSYSSYYVIKGNIVFIKDKIIYSLNLITNEEIIVGLCKKYEWIEANNGNIIYTADGKQYDILEDKSDSEEIRNYRLCGILKKSIIVVIILVIILVTIIF